MQKELQPRHSVWCVGTNAQTCIALIAAAVVRLRMAQDRCQTRLQQAIAAARQRWLDDAAQKAVTRELAIADFQGAVDGETAPVNAP